MPSHPTRRRFIATSLVASSVVPTNDVLAIGDIEKVRLMRHREYLQSEIAKLDRQWALAYAKLPSWCRPGPKYRDQDGRLFGGIVGWPDAGTDSMKLDDGVFLVRPSVRDIFALREADRAIMSDEQSERCFRLRLSQLKSRVRLKRSFEREANLPTTSDWLPFEFAIETIESAGYA